MIEVVIIEGVWLGAQVGLESRINRLLKNSVSLILVTECQFQV